MPQCFADDNAVTLLPIAHEYQIDPLMKRCEAVLMEQRKPRLQVIALAERYQLDSLLRTSVEACAKNLDSFSIEQQSHSVTVTEGSLLQIYK